MPVWSPDGTRIAFGSRRNSKWGLYIKLADNTRAEELQIESEIPMQPMAWSPDGKLLVYWTRDLKTSGDVWALPLTGEKKPAPILNSIADERYPQVSPDGKSIAYTSNESGRSEIYISDFPQGPGKIQVSVNGGLFPRWRRDGRELYSLSLISAGAMMESEIRITGSSVQREVPRLLFQAGFVNGAHAPGPYHAYAVSANGQRFLIPQPENILAELGRGRGPRGNLALPGAILNSVFADRLRGAASSGSAAPITVVLNWTSTLK